MSASDEIMVKVIVKPSSIMNYKSGYRPTIEVFGTGNTDPSPEFICDMLNMLANNGYPNHSSYFCPPKCMVGQDLLDNFYSYLAFTVIDRRLETVCGYNNYKDENHKKSFSECTNVLNKIAISIIRFSLKFQLGDKSNPEIIKSFFEGEFFKEFNKNRFISAHSFSDPQKSLLIESAKTFFSSIRSPGLFPRAKELCDTLLQKVNRVIHFEDVSLCESKKNKLSKGGSKQSSKFYVTDEQKKSLYQEFANRNPDAISAYKKGKRGSIKMLSRFIWEALKDDDRTSKISDVTTRRWAANLLKEHCNK